MPALSGAAQDGPEHEVQADGGEKTERGADVHAAQQRVGRRGMSCAIAVEPI